MSCSVKGVMWAVGLHSNHLDEEELQLSDISQGIVSASRRPDPTLMRPLVPFGQMVCRTAHLDHVLVLNLISCYVTFGFMNCSLLCWRPFHGEAITTANECRIWSPAQFSLCGCVQLLQEEAPGDPCPGARVAATQPLNCMLSLLFHRGIGISSGQWLVAETEKVTSGQTNSWNNAF